MLARIARNTAAQSLYLVVQFADRFLVVGILLRTWGPEVYADWAVILSCVGLLSIGELGLNIYYGNVMQKAWAVADARGFQRMIAIALTCSLTIALILGLLGLALLTTVDVPRFLSVTALPASEALGVLALLGLATLSRIARGSVSQIFRGRQEFALGIATDTFCLAALVALMVIAGLLGVDPLVMAATYLVTDLAAGWVFMLWALRKRYPGLALSPGVPKRVELEIIAQHARWLSVQQGGVYAWLQAPVVILGWLGTAGVNVVSFVVMRTLVNFARSLGTMLTMGSGVEIAAAYHEGRREAVGRHLQMVGHSLSILTAAMAVGIILFGPAIVAIWTGRSDLYSQVIVLSLLASAAVAAPVAPLSAHLIYSNMPRAASLAFLAQLAIGLIACVFFARAYGATGAAVGLAIGEGIGQGVVLPFLAARQADGLSYLRYCLCCAGAMVATALWCGLVGIVVVSLIQTSNWPGLGLASCLWGLLGLGPALVLALPSHYREAVAWRAGWRLPGRSKTA